MSPWSSPPPGSEPWPPEPWQPEPARQSGPPQDDRPWGEQPPERPWGEPPRERPWAEQQQENPWSGPPQERPWGEQPQERPWAEQPQERPWAEQPQERPWSEQPQERPWGEQPQENPWSGPPQERPWGGPPGDGGGRQDGPDQRWGAPPQQRPWDAEPGGRPWSGGPEPQHPPRTDGEQWLPDDGPRWRGPLIAGLVAALLTAAIVVGYVFWTKDDDGPQEPVAGPSTSQNAPDTGTDAPETAPDGEPPAAGDPETEAQAVDALLAEMSDSRKKLAGITYACENKSQDIATFETAVQERESQLSDARELPVGSLDGGAEIKEALVNALQASIESNQEALTWLRDEGGCGQDAAARLKDVTDRATDTKRVFLDLWNPVATAQGLPTWTRENI